MNYQFEQVGANDGVEIVYKEPTRGREETVIWPTSSTDPQRMDLFGCDNKPHALGYAKLMWNRRKYERTTVSFDTELEGLIVRVGDRIAVSNDIPTWGAQ